MLAGAEPGAIDAIYDDDCPLCRRFYGAIEGWGREHLIEVVDIAEVATQHRFRHLDVSCQAATGGVRPARKSRHGVESRRLTQLLPVFAD